MSLNEFYVVYLRKDRAKENYALNNRTAAANSDGSITFHFNAPGKPNNIDVVDGWTLLIRLYAPISEEAIMAYIRDVEASVNVERLP